MNTILKFLAVGLLAWPVWAQPQMGGGMMMGGGPATQQMGGGMMMGGGPATQQMGGGMMMGGGPVTQQMGGGMMMGGGPATQQMGGGMMMGGGPAPQQMGGGPAPQQMGGGPAPQQMGGGPAPQQMGGGPAPQQMGGQQQQGPTGTNVTRRAATYVTPWGGGGMIYTPGSQFKCLLNIQGRKLQIGSTVTDGLKPLIHSPVSTLSGNINPARRMLRGGRQLNMGFIRFVDKSPEAINQDTPPKGTVISTRKMIAGSTLPSIGVRRIFKTNVAHRYSNQPSGRVQRKMIRRRRY
jgi:hypothetical protein